MVNNDCFYFMFSSPQGIDLGIIAFRNETLEQESMADPFRIKNNRFIDNIVEEDIRVKHLKTKCLA